MKLKSGFPFSLIKNGLITTYPKLEKNCRTDVLVLGGGISGALVSYHLTKQHIPCIVLDARSIGLGSTCASTSLLQYEIDVPLAELSQQIGLKKAVRSYQLCKQSIDELFEIAITIGFTDIMHKKSLYLAAYKKDVQKLEAEYAIRKKNGFRVSYLPADELKMQTGISAPGGIISEDAAQTDAYLFTHALLRYVQEKGVEVYDRSMAMQIQHARHYVDITCENGYHIRAKKLIYATGYESIQYIPKKTGTLYATYAMVSEALSLERPFWNNEMLIWNTADPYLYMRATSDSRIMVGGRDEQFYSPVKRDRLLPKKTKQLTGDFHRIFPAIDFKPEFSWTGTFMSTKDGLPFIDTYKALPNSYFALGFGGNGITFSQVAASIITRLIKTGKSRDAAIFSFDRI